MSIRGFLMRRFIRIFPLYWLATLLWVAYSARFGIVPNVEHVVRSALLIPDLSHVWFPVYVPAWSLVFEIFFYAVFAACMLTGRFARISCCIVLLIVAFTFSDPGNPNSLDGGHTAALTLNDLEIAGASLAPHGVAVLDDVFNGNWPW